MKPTHEGASAPSHPCYNGRAMWMMSMLCTVLAAVVALGLVNRLGLPRWVELLAGLVLVGLAQRYFLIRAFRTHILSPDAAPPWLLLLFLSAEAFLLAAAPLTSLWWALRVQNAPLPAGVIRSACSSRYADRRCSSRVRFMVSSLFVAIRRR